MNDSDYLVKVLSTRLKDMLGEPFLKHSKMLLSMEDILNSVLIANMYLDNGLKEGIFFFLFDNSTITNGRGEI